MLESDSSSEVLVVGAGPVGLFAALELRRRGVEVEIIDSQPRTAERSYALALHARTLAAFDDVGLLDSLVAEARRVDTVGLFDREGRRATIELGALSGSDPHVLVIPQSTLERCLEERLEAAGVEVHWNHRLVGLELDEDVVQATVYELTKESTGYSAALREWMVERASRIGARFVIGADGYHSAVRRLAGIEIEDRPGGQKLALFECASDRDPGTEMKVVLENGLASVFWPLSGQRFRWSFEIGSDEAVEERVKQRLAVQVGEQTFPYQSPERLSELLAERAPWFDLSAESVNWSIAVNFRRRVVREFGRGPVSLLGDAAHQGAPIGVQSMNGGLADARDLTRLVAEMLSGSGSRDEIDAFDLARAVTWSRESDAATAESEGNSWIAQRARTIRECLPALGGDLERLMAQLDSDEAP